MTACWCGSTTDILWHENRPLCLEHLPNTLPKMTYEARAINKKGTVRGGLMPENRMPGDYAEWKKERSR